MKKYLKKLEETKPVIYCGDLNVAHNEIGKPGLFLPIIAWNRWCSGAVVQWSGTRTHNTEVVSSIPPCVTIKTPLVRKATGNHLTKSPSLEETESSVSDAIDEEGNAPRKIHFPRKNSALYLVSATLEIEYATQFFLIEWNMWRNFRLESTATRTK